MNVFFCTACRRAAPRLLQLAWGLTISLCLPACGPAPRSVQSLPSATPAVAPPPAPKTLESTLRLDPGVEEIPFYPQIAQSNHGDAVAVWEQFDGEHYNIWGNSRRAHHGWGHATLIQTNDSGHSYNPRVAINSNGQAAAVWVQMNSVRGSQDIWSSHLEPGAGWGRPVRVETGNAGPACAPAVAIDEHGNAVAAWQQSDGRHVDIRVNRFVAGVGWGRASRLERGDGDPGAPHVAVDSSGSVMVVWSRFQLNRSALWANRHAPGAPSSRWGRAERIASVPGYVHTPQVMATAGGLPGEFTVLWTLQEGFHTGVGASRYQPGRGWRSAGDE